MKWVKNTARFLIVTVGVVVLTSLGIDASQYLAGSQSALGILADRATEGGCPVGMSSVVRAGDDLCVDTYEVSVGENCPMRDPKHFSQTANNIAAAECFAVSESDKKPWTNVTYHQARELCARSGKRLPINREWYESALGASESSCAVDDSQVQITGSAGCISGSGTHDMIGNVWEWVEAEVVAGQYGDRTLPENGYVQNADAVGVATLTSNDPSDAYGHDYFWSQAEGNAGMMRGGFYNSQSDAGLYTVHAAMDLNFAGSAIGFRCVK